MLRYLFIALFAFVIVHGNAQDKLYMLVLGTAQDGGYPHLGCMKQCCNRAWKDPALKRFVVSLALVNPATNQWWLFEATPDIKEQLHYFQTLTNNKYKYLPDAIFVTHAHIGHYTGLMQLGREVLNSKNVPVYVLPKMQAFLNTNGPWSQLVSLGNISLQLLQPDSPVIPANGISITVFMVPHRDEYSETAGYRISTPNRSYLFIPDINKWSKWGKDIVAEVSSVDVAFIDATFYDETELPGRPMSEVSHPLVSETMQLFQTMNAKIKNKVHFIHLNHTNPLLWNNKISDQVRSLKFNIAEQGKKL